MHPSPLDRLISWVGLALAALLIVAGPLLTWANNFVTNEVHTQLAAQQIYFPAQGSPATAAIAAFIAAAVMLLLSGLGLRHSRLLPAPQPDPISDSTLAPAGAS